MDSFESKGKLYESWLFVLLLIKAYGMQFAIGKEVMVGHKFDDVALRYKNKDTGKLHHIFFQVKHVDDAEHKILTYETLTGKQKISAHSDDFNLSKYFISYMRLSDQFIGTNNKLEKLIIYTNVSGLEKDIECAIENEGGLSSLLSAKQTNKSIYLNMESEKIQHIANILKRIESDLDFLVNLLYNYSVKKYTEPMTLEDGGILSYYHTAFVNEEVFEIFEKNNNNNTKRITKCKFHNNFIQEKFKTDRARLLWNKVFEKVCEDTDITMEEFKNILKQHEWKVSKGFGKVPDNHCENTKTGAIKLPSYSIEEHHVNDFLNMLEFKIGEPNVSEISKYVENQIEINKFFKLSADYINFKTKQLITNWRNLNPQKEGWIEDPKTFLKDFKQEISKLETTRISNDHFINMKILIDKYKLNFKEPVHKNFLQNEDKNCCVIYSQETILSTLKIVQYEDDSRALLFDEKDITNESKLNEIYTVLQQEENEIIVIVNWESSTSNEKLDNFIKTIKTKYNLKLIIIANEKISLKGNCLQIKDKAITIDDLELESVENILQTKISVRNKQICLYDIIYQDDNNVLPLKSIVTPTILKNIITGGTKFLNQNYCLDIIVSSYIPRTLAPPVISQAKIFNKQVGNNCEQEVFAISGANVESDISKQIFNKGNSETTSLFLNHNNVEEQLNKLTEEYSNKQNVEEENFRQFKKNIHWLEYKSKQLIWKKTVGSVSYLIDKKHEHSSESFEEVELFNFNKNLEIITGIAGLGKSTFINNLTKDYTKNNSSVIVIQIDFNHIQKIYKEPNKFVKDNLNCLDFFCKLLPEKTCFEMQIIKFCIKNKHETILLFDGYDEIPSSQFRTFVRRKILELSLIINGNIYITTRPNVVNELELEFNLLAITLNQFTLENQRSCLKDFFHTHLQIDNIDETLLNEYVDDLIDFIKNSLNDREKTIIGIPLQLKMVGEIYKENCEDFLLTNGNKIELLREFDSISIYKYFVDTMYKRYYLEKRFISLDMVRELDPNNYDNYILNHQKLAMDAFIRKQHPNDLEVLFPNTNFKSIKENIGNLINIGIIKDNTFQFIHQTFAEYFTATFLIEHVFCTTSTEIQRSFLLTEILFNDYYQNLRVFLNGLLKNHEISQEVSTIYKDQMVKYANNLNNEGNCFITSVYENNEHIFTFLIECCNGSDDLLDTILNAVDNYNNSCLHYVVDNNNISILKYLIKRNINTNAKNNINNSALHFAATNGNIDIAKLLIENKCDINAQNAVNNTPLLVAAVNGHLNVVKFLIENKCDININGYENYTPLHEASSSGHLEVVKFLIENKCDINAKTANNDTPLHLAIYRGHTNVAKFLLENKCVTNVQNQQGVTPLHEAVYYGRIEIVKLLLNSEAIQVNCKCGNGKEPLHYATDKGFIEIIEILIENKCDVNARNNNNETPLHVAIFNGDYNAVKILIENGADINSPSTDNNTPLHLAVMEGHRDIVKLLIKNKSNVNAQNMMRCTVLHIVCVHGDLEIVKLLLENGCDVNSKTESHNTALHFAAFNGHFEIVQCLKENMCDVDSRNIDNETAVDGAASNGHLNIVKYLMEN